jgi:hypothetical protein
MTRVEEKMAGWAGVAPGRAGQVGCAQTVNFPFHQRIFQFTLKVPAQKYKTQTFLCPKTMRLDSTEDNFK